MDFARDPPSRGRYNDWMKFTGNKIALSVLLSAGVILCAAGFISIAWDLPAVDSLGTNLSNPSVRITDRNGRLLYDVLPEEGGRHMNLPAAIIPTCMKEATVAVEDRSFYENPGVDPVGILRAAWLNAQASETISGGSTITQQVARNLLLNHEERAERTLRRKIREAILALQLQNRVSKEEILALYLNQTYYGGMAYGIEAAAQTFFGKPVTDLLTHECALLAGLPQAPAVYNPYTHPDLAKARQRVVLGLMEQAGYLTEAERMQSSDAPLIYNPAPYPISAPHFVWMVKNELDAYYQSGQVDPRASLVVRTTLTLDAQRIAEAAITRQLAEFDQHESVLDRSVDNSALVAIDPRSGEILALVGSADFFNAEIHGAINMAITPRQPGSAFKPFLYALALEPSRTDSWTAATPLLDVTTTFLLDDGVPYTPQDYDLLEHGPVPLRRALASSLNIPAVITLNHVGIPAVLELAGRLGIRSLADGGGYDLSLALGGGEMSLLELTDAYATLANGGRYVSPSIIMDIRDSAGAILLTPEKAAPLSVIDPRVAWLISDILSDDAARTIGFTPNSSLNLDRPAAVKTGTTTNFTDNWTVGYTPNLVVGVWVGNAGYEPMRNVTGLTGAAPIWNTVMRTILQATPALAFERPGGMELAEVCDLTGLRPGPACPYARREWFIDGTEPAEMESMFRIVIVDSRSGLLADEFTPPEWRRSLTVWNLPAAAEPWAREHGLPLLVDFGSEAPGETASTPAIQLISPVPNSAYRLVASLERNAQQLPVEAVVGWGVTQVRLFVDGTLLAEFHDPPYRVWWVLVPGVHRFHAEGVAADGSRIRSPEVTITVEEVG